jgi:2'-5' RNA ligase
MIRLFTALSVPDDVAEALARRQTGLPGANWRTADQLHITLAFYGGVDERRADDLSIELERAATGGPVRAFPVRRRRLRRRPPHPRHLGRASRPTSGCPSWQAAAAAPPSAPPSASNAATTARI